MSRTIRLAALTAASFVGLTAAAAADEIAYTKSAANLREGPGTRYDIIETLPRNTEVWVEACNTSWCSVTVDDDDELAGFISKSLLKANRSGRERPFSIEITIDPFAGFSFGPPPRQPGPPPRQPGPPGGSQPFPPGPPGQGQFPSDPPPPPQGGEQPPSDPPIGQPTPPPPGQGTPPAECLNLEPGDPVPPFCPPLPNGPGGGNPPGPFPN